MNYKVRCGSKSHKISIDNKADLFQDNTFEVGRNSLLVKLKEQANAGDIKLVSVDHKLYSVKIRRRPDGLPYKVIINGRAYVVDVERVESTRFRPATLEKKIDSTVSALLPGQITKVMVNDGEKVKRGQVLMILEAMKMENEITAPIDGIVNDVKVREGQLVSKNDLLIELK